MGQLNWEERWVDSRTLRVTPPPSCRHAAFTFPLYSNANCLSGQDSLHAHPTPLSLQLHAVFCSSRTAAARRMHVHLQIGGAQRRQEGGTSQESAFEVTGGQRDVRSGGWGCFRERGRESLITLTNWRVGQNNRTDRVL